MEARRPFEREPGERVETRPVEATAFQLRDLVHWGPVWSGFLVATAVTALLVSLGIAVSLTATAGGAAAPPAPGTPAGTGLGIWAPISLIIGLFAGGWLMMRLSSLGGVFVSLAHGVLLWALTVGAIAFLGALGLAMPGVTGVIPGMPGDAAATATGAWGSFIAILLALGAAVLGAWLGNPGVRAARMERLERAAA
ncbi:MAG: hypothetical protein HY689_07455 [Chloroflexi bacterium]|nr:hypothetical protein [Chloroflexota bacterium]